MAERSTAAVDVAKTSGEEKPLSEKASDEATADGGAEGHSRDEKNATAAGEEAAPRTEAPELHSGHKLARRYRLEECVTRLDGFSSWRAVDEKLRRAVGIHVLPARHPRARPVLAAARSAALLGDPRFVQVLDAVENDDLVYVVHEWLPDATPLSEVLATGPLPAHEAYQLVGQLAQGLAAAHREGLAHLRISPSSVLRTSTGQYRVRGLAVGAALRGTRSEHPQRTDTEAIGAVLYAALTQRWPYETDAYGLSGVGALAKGSLVAPDQVRAGVHRGLSELAMRALVNDGATASRQEQPCATPEELAEAVAAMPRVPQPEPAFTAPPAYERTTYQRGSYVNGAGPGPRRGGPAAPPPGSATPPALPGRAGKALKWGVSTLLIAALGLGSWQISDALMHGGTHSSSSGDDQPRETGRPSQPDAQTRPLNIAGSAEYQPDGSFQDAEDVSLSHDGDLATLWRTKSYRDGPQLSPYKEGVGIVYDLGDRSQLHALTVKLHYAGAHTALSLYAADSLDPSTPLSSLRKLASTRTSSDSATLELSRPQSVRHVVLWLTALPKAPSDDFSSSGYKQGVSEVTFTGE
ncbi:protein kinase family protein [Streptomyces sp. JJ36]|uniref:protein kinase family protein n=1 Tax=Streptomyces sp. JJ36 TaxID=2736645 RepID=UPI001F1F877C|nr:protein kinase family protein [Streptomyces sp. JJ36]MCF6522199.1 protein kinase family protein [Streptomyces sp. JJ36]